MNISLYHGTTFAYAGSAHDSFNEVRLHPLDDACQTCRSFDLRVDPSAQIRDYVDFYGNTVHYFDISEGHSKLVIEAVSEVETTPNGARPAVPAVPFTQFAESHEHELQAEFLTGSHYVPLDVELWKESQDVLAGRRTDVWSDVRSLPGTSSGPSSTGRGRRGSARSRRTPSSCAPACARTSRTSPSASAAAPASRPAT
jgi:transglutaminase-like putative cysteine protease